MFVPAAFASEDPSTLEAMIERAGLAVLVTHGRDGLFATHLPVLHETGGFLGHLARANPHRERAGDGEALLIFPGPQAYVSPAWYPSKAEHGRTVPTWNYEAVHVYGTLSWFEDRERLLRGIVGVFLTPTRVEVSRKLSQNRDEADRAGVIAGLSAEPSAQAHVVAELMSAGAA